MRGYLAHHRSHLYDGVRADYYRNDPYVWFSPYLWRFCRLNQHPRVEEGMTIVWCSNADGRYVCDLVMVVGEILPFRAALERYSRQDDELARRHFERGMRHHSEVQRVDVKTYVADMSRSYIPHPAVPIEREVDAFRIEERPTSKPLKIAWGRPSVPLRIEAIDHLARTVFDRAQTASFTSRAYEEETMAPLPDLAEEQHINSCTPEMRGWYDALKTLVLGLREDIEVHPRMQYIGFWRVGAARPSRVFAYVNFRPSRNLLFIDIIHPQGEMLLEDGFLTQVPGKGWKENLA